MVKEEVLFTTALRYDEDFTIVVRSKMARRREARWYIWIFRVP